MLDQIYLTEEEKDKLSKKYNDYISNAIHKSDNELHRITKKYLLPKSKETKNNYQHYYKELSKTGEEITTQISKDEASLPRHRVKKWTKIQAIRNKAYNLHAYWHPKIRHADKKIKYADIIRQIEKKEDRVSKKYYNKIFDNEIASVMLPSLIKCTAYINDPEAPLDKFSPIILMSRNSDECGSFHSWHSQIFHSQLRISFDRFNGQISLQTIDDYLLACSIATATATVILSLRVVTCANQAHHPYSFY